MHLVLASTLQRMDIKHRGELASALMQRKEYAGDRDLPPLVWYGLIPLARKHPNELVDIAIRCEWPAEYQRIARFLASRLHEEPAAFDRFLKLATSRQTEFQMEALAGMNRALKGLRRVRKPEAWTMFSRTTGAQRSPEVVRELNILFGDGRALRDLQKLALNKGTATETRRSAIRSIISARPNGLRKFLESLINDRAVNAEVVKGLALYDDPAIGERIAKNFNRFQQTDRPIILETLVSRSSFATALLNEINAERIPASTLSAFHARQIRELGDELLTRKLSSVWGEVRDSPAERKAIMQRYREQLTPDALAESDLQNGRLLFRKTCSACHQLYEDGTKIGPNLTGAQRSSLDYLLENILDPSAVVSKDYRMSVVLMKDGRSFNGLVVSKDETRVVLQTAVEQRTIAMTDIDEISEKPLSPMPDGLLQNLTEKEVRDLIGYLMHPTQVALPK